MAEPLKAQFSRDVPERLARDVRAVYRAFKSEAFLRDALEGFEAMELLDRGRHLADVLQRHLPSDVPRAIGMLVDTLPAQRSAEGGMAAFYYLPHTEYIRRHALEHFDEAMRGLHAFTQHFTGEFAIRPFIERYPDAALAQLHAWTHDPSEHVRRLVSEGTRPRLPWAPRLRTFLTDPTPVLALLEALRDDSSLYVRRSVANHLNDLYKDHPAQLLATVKDWMAQASPERRWVIEHALRSAVKRGDSSALALLGFGGKAQLTIGEVALTPLQPRMGEKVVISCSLHNATRRSQQVVVDLIVHFVKSNGESNPKVFKMANIDIASGSTMSVRKTVSLADLTTRRHYPGVHRVELQLNGKVTSLGEFTLRPASVRHARA
ncbi:MAG: DNA alkylation repair protein [Gemmatimonadaceae bacterium]|nr:DNA alkylation repair protein [Gemmatimonadaceae bacterium]